jgi:hypothetical protein
MRTIRTFLLGTLLVAAPLHTISAQPAPSAVPSAAPTAPPAAPPTTTRYEIATDVDAAMSDKSQALFKDGNNAFRDGKYALARASYKAAYALDPKNVKVVSNLGRTELELQLYRDAAEHLTVGVRLADPTDPKRDKMKSALDETRAKVGTITMKVKAGGAEVPGVEIVDMATGQSYMTPLTDPIFINPGKASFRIRREGYESQEKVFELSAGGETSVDIELVRPPNYVRPAATSTASAAVTDPEPVPRSKVPGYVVGGVGVAAVIIGGALLGIAAGQGSDIRNKAPKDANDNPTCNRTALPNEDSQCADLRATAQSASAMGNAGIGVLVAGGLFAGAGVIYLLLPNPEASASKRSSKVVPVVSHEGGGLVWTGSF